VVVTNLNWNLLIGGIFGIILLTGIFRHRENMKELDVRIAETMNIKKQFEAEAMEASSSWWPFK
jgi:hypothetical protein